ncbi:MAG: ABC transporter substrate-binding protein [Deltaproteobacteria bacterium]|nr:ABC transporter substrate-binding protein [Deltaproteobacteria bacterium]
MNRTLILLKRSVVSIGILVTVLFSPQVVPNAVAASNTISFGVLPVIQALPLFVAREKGYFSDEGLNVELITFRSGLEKDAAMAAGRTQGYFGDMLTSLILDANQIPSRMVATIYNTTGDQRMFAVLAAPGTGKPSLAELAEAGIAGSSNTVIEYLTRRLLQAEAPGAKLNLIEAKSIPSRVPMLLSGRVPGAVLPEPLVTFVEKKGATVVADDRGKGIAPTVLLFTEKFLRERRDDARRFLAATARASAFISENPQSVRPIMIRYGHVPKSLQNSLPIPAFAPPSVPKRRLVMDSYNWLRSKGILKSELTWGDMVQEGLL